MTHEGTESARPRVVSVCMFPVTVKKGNNTRPDKEQDQTTKRNETGPGGPVQE